MKRRLGGIVVVLCCSMLAGCYQKSSENGSLVYTFQPWLPVLVAVAGVAAVPIGILIFMRSKKRSWGVTLFILGPLAAGVIAPTLYLDRVVVSQNSFFSRHGFWWNPTVHQIPYDELKLVRVGAEERNSRRGKTYNYYFDCQFKSGKQDRVPLGDVMQEALPDIIEQFQLHGVSVEVPPNLPK